MHPLIWVVLAYLAVVVVLALVDAVRYRRRLKDWRPDVPPLGTTVDPSEVWEVQAREGHQR